MVSDAARFVGIIDGGSDNKMEQLYELGKDAGIMFLPGQASFREQKKIFETFAPEDIDVSTPEGALRWFTGTFIGRPAESPYYFFDDQNVPGINAPAIVDPKIVNGVGNPFLNQAGINLDDLSNPGLSQTQLDRIQLGR